MPRARLALGWRFAMNGIVKTSVASENGRNSWLGVEERRQWKDARMSSDKNEKTFLWMSIDSWVKVIVTAIVTVIVTLWLTEKPHVVYTVAEPFKFTGDNEKFGMVGCWISNFGSKTAENVVCVYDLPESKVKDLVIVPDTFQAEKK